MKNRSFRTKKREIAALQTAAAKIELDLKGREAAFSRVNSSLSKHLEETLLEEFPHEYVQNNSKNWLKLQQDIAYVKKYANVESKKVFKVRSLLEFVISVLDFDMQDKI